MNFGVSKLRKQVQSTTDVCALNPGHPHGLRVVQALYSIWYARQLKQINNPNLNQQKHCECLCVTDIRFYFSRIYKKVTHN